MEEWRWLTGNVLGPQSEWLWVMCQFFAIAISLSLIYRQMRIQHRANMLHTLSALDQRWNSQDMLAHRKDVCGKCEGDQLWISKQGGIVLGFFEDIGVYLERRVLDRDAVWDKYSYYVEYYWGMYEPHIKEFRVHISDPTVYEKFEMLFKAMTEFSKKKGIAVAGKTRDEIQRFCRGET